MMLAVCIPILNDWTAAALLLRRLDAVLTGTPHRVDVLLVDDGSDEPAPKALDWEPKKFARVSILRLRRNVGHQRAIAIGLTHLYEHASHDGVIVMDGDGEDLPEDVPRLLERAASLAWTKVVFARRERRSEGLSFRLGYVAFKLLHRILVGRRVEVGNFSVVPRSALARLVSVSELWNHYAASVYHARIPVDTIPTARGMRAQGKTKMNFVGLVTHGLSAISVYGDVVGVRLLAAIVVAIFLAGLALAAVIGIRLGTDLAVPGWATNAVGTLVIGLLNLSLLSVMMVLFTLGARTEYGFLPLRDYRHFVFDELVLREGEP